MMSAARRRLSPGLTGQVTAGMCRRVSRRAGSGMRSHMRCLLLLAVTACGGGTVGLEDAGARDSALDSASTTDGSTTSDDGTEDSGTLPMPCVQAGRCLDGLYCVINISSDGGSEEGTCLGLPSNCPPVPTCACIPAEMDCECSDDGQGHVRYVCQSVTAG